MKRCTYVFLMIISFGFFKLYLNKKAKLIAYQKNDKLIVSEKFSFDIENFINDLGGIKNIRSVNSTINNVIVDLEDTTLVKENLKQTYNIRGINRSAHQLILVFGDNASAIANKLKEELNL